MTDICGLTRNKICYVILGISIFFFLSSVCTFAVLAVTKEDKVHRPPPEKIEQIKESPQMEQRKIIKRLKRIEDRMKKREIKRNEQ